MITTTVERILDLINRNPGKHVLLVAKGDKLHTSNPDSWQAITPDVVPQIFPGISVVPLVSPSKAIIKIQAGTEWDISRVTLSPRPFGDNSADLHESEDRANNPAITAELTTRHLFPEITTLGDVLEYDLHYLRVHRAEFPGDRRALVRNEPSLVVLPRLEPRDPNPKRLENSFPVLSVRIYPLYRL